MRGQSRLMSMVETVANVGSGVALGVIVGQMVFPLYGFRPSVAENTSITLIFTGVSVVRGYLWRRLFNWLHERAEPLAVALSEVIGEDVR